MPARSARQAMRLRVVDHLQPVLDPAQEAVGLDQRVGASRRRCARRRRARAAPRRSARRAARGIAAAPDQLLRLGEELDLADAAAAELDVVAGDRDSAAAAMRVDLALDRVDVLDRREIEMPAPDKGLQLARGSAAPAARSPATGRALIMAARSQFWPTRLVIGSAPPAPRSPAASSAGSGRSRRSVRKT